MSKEIKILATSSFGAKIEGEAWERGLNWGPDVIVAQGTTSDGGPNYLGTDMPYAGARDVKKGLRGIILSARKKGIPFIISSGSPGGSNVELARSLDAVDEISREANVTLRIAVIPGELDKEYLKEKIRSGAQVRRLVNTAGLPEFLSVGDVDTSKRIVAQMGPEPIIKALDLGVDGVITGRALDIGLYMALPLKKGFDKGLAAHMAKTIECAGLVAVPQSFEAVFATLREDHFLVCPTNPAARCTVVSVASHAFYERPDPIREENPGGVLDVGGAKYEQSDEQTVRVSGGRWIPAPYTLKIEGIRQVGYRTICIFGIRDERMIVCIDSFLEDARRYVQEKYRPLKPEKDYTLIFRIYGKNGVLGEQESVKPTKSHELGVIVDVVAREQELANAVCVTVADFAAHMDYPGRLTTAANVAFPYSPREHSMGPVYVYSIWHQLDLDDPCEPFGIQVREFPSGVA